MIKLYTLPGCPQCRMVHMLLDKKGIKYEEIQDIDIIKNKGINHTPAIETEDGSIIQGKAIFEFVNSSLTASCSSCEVK